MFFPVFAFANSANDPGFIGTDKQIVVPIPQKADFPHWDAEQNQYVGILVERYQPSIPNSTSSNDYIDRVKVEGKEQWFIPAAQASNGVNFVIKWDHDQARNTLLGGKAELDSAGVQHNLVEDNFTFKLTVYHLFRLSDGDYRQSAAKELFYAVNFSPIINIASPTDNQAFSEIDGYNQIKLSGLVKDLDADDKLKVYYRINGSTGQPDAQVGTEIIANGDNQPFTTTYINIKDYDLNEGNHNLYVWVEDDKGGSSLETVVPFKISKTGPIVEFLPKTRGWANHDVSVKLIINDDEGVNTEKVWYVWSESSKVPDNIEDEQNKLKDLTLSQSEDGIWYLHVRATDGVENIADHCGGPYKIDTIGPVTIADPAVSVSLANDPEIINCEVADEASGVDSPKSRYIVTRYINPPDPSDSGWKLLDDSSTIIINDEGTWYLHTRVTDRAGNTNEKTFGPYQHVYNTKSPVVFVTINGGEESTTMKDLSIEVKATDEFTDPDNLKAQLSFDMLEWTEKESLDSNGMYVKTMTISEEALENIIITVYAKVTDPFSNVGYGNASIMYGKTQIQQLLEGIGPTIFKVSGQNGATATKGTTFNIVISASGASVYRARLDNSENWSEWTPVSDPITIDNINTTGAHTIYVEAKNSWEGKSIGQMLMFKL